MKCMHNDYKTISSKRQMIVFVILLISVNIESHLKFKKTNNNKQYNEDSNVSNLPVNKEHSC